MYYEFFNTQNAIAHCQRPVDIQFMQASKSQLSVVSSGPKVILQK